MVNPESALLLLGATLGDQYPTRRETNVLRKEAYRRCRAMIVLCNINHRRLNSSENTTGRAAAGK